MINNAVLQDSLAIFMLRNSNNNVNNNMVQVCGRYIVVYIVIYDDAVIRYSARCIISICVCVRAHARTLDALKGLPVLQDDKFCCSHIFRDSSYVRR